jgi:hypothetical protein
MYPVTPAMTATAIVSLVAVVILDPPSPEIRTSGFSLTPFPSLVWSG